ncbi:DnaA regulatory inactivator Hda [Agaribacterium sp. ZY112]|uniref:DnaA regulatory inactivator Hda n=1 Tax=Agaribacterium sp. ZY112 TaxID=3233574 RepID=UPI00352330FB
MQQGTPRQLSLAVGLFDEAYFSNFCLSDDNRQVVAALTMLSEGQQQGHILLWGAQGAGLTHLLQASCHHAVEHGLSHQYLPLAELCNLSPELVVDGLEQQQLVCIDGLEHIAGNARWEQALFHLFNRIRDMGHSTLMSSHSSPQELGIALPDLASRLKSGLTFKVHSLSDEGKVQALRERAQHRGMDLSSDVAAYILSHSDRDPRALFALLDRLDRLSLEQQRKLTIPFVKGVLEQN